jgi:hypothetical protein
LQEDLSAEVYSDHDSRWGEDFNEIEYAVCFSEVGNFVDVEELLLGLFRELIEGGEGELPFELEVFAEWFEPWIHYFLDAFES